MASSESIPPILNYGIGQAEDTLAKIDAYVPEPYLSLPAGLKSYVSRRIANACGREQLLAEDLAAWAIMIRKASDQNAADIKSLIWTETVFRNEALRYPEESEVAAQYLDKADQVVRKIRDFHARPFPAEDYNRALRVQRMDHDARIRDEKGRRR